MSSAGTVLIAKILARHGARPDLRLWRNEVSGAWMGEKKGVIAGGFTVLHRGARFFVSGLVPGSADLVGLTGRGHPKGKGRFVGVEVKAEGDRLQDNQRKWLALVEGMGGLAGVVSSLEEADELLGTPP